MKKFCSSEYALQSSFISIIFKTSSSNSSPHSAIFDLPCFECKPSALRKILSSSISVSNFSQFVFLSSDFEMETFQHHLPLFTDLNCIRSTTSSNVSLLSMIFFCTIRYIYILVRVDDAFLRGVRSQRKLPSFLELTRTKRKFQVTTTGLAFLTTLAFFFKEFYSSPPKS